MSATDDRRKTVLITGCSAGGIGNALARAFHSRGYRVFATARRAEALTDLSVLGMETLSLTVDSEESIQECLSEIRKRCPADLDYLINNAGVSMTIPALDAGLEDAKRCFDTNFFAVVRMVQVFSPLLIEAKGTIVMIGSLAAEMPFVFGSIYNASKAALHAYSNTLRIELAQFDVKVITVISGGVRSRLTQKVDRALPATSLYKPIEDDFGRRKLHSAAVGISTEEYAEDIIGQIVPGSGPWPWRWFLEDARRRWIWAGTGSLRVWLLAGGWLRHGLFDWYFTKLFRLSKLRDKPEDGLRDRLWRSRKQGAGTLIHNQQQGFVENMFTARNIRSNYRTHNTVRLSSMDHFLEKHDLRGHSQKSGLFLYQQSASLHIAMVVGVEPFMALTVILVTLTYVAL